MFVDHTYKPKTPERNNYQMALKYTLLDCAIFAPVFKKKEEHRSDSSFKIAALIYEDLGQYQDALDIIKKANRLGFTIPEGTVKRIEKKLVKIKEAREI